MDKYLFAVLIMALLIGTTGCSTIQGTKVMNFFSYKNILDYATNCSVNKNIDLNLSYCNGNAKRPIYYNYDLIDNWSQMCCTFDSRCLAKTNANVSLICQNFNASYTYIGPIYDDSGSGSMCCNGGGQCFVDHLPNSNCTTALNATAAVATIAFNLTGTTEWNAMCCISGGY